MRNKVIESIVMSDKSDAKESDVMFVSHNKAVKQSAKKKQNNSLYAICGQ